MDKPEQQYIHCRALPWELTALLNYPVHRTFFKLILQSFPPTFGSKAYMFDSAHQFLTLIGAFLSVSHPFFTLTGMMIILQGIDSRFLRNVILNYTNNTKTVWFDYF